MNKYLLSVLFIFSTIILAYSQNPEIAEPIIYPPSQSIYMAPWGDDANDGSMASPVASFSEALWLCPFGTNEAHAYSEIVLLSGTYTPAEEMRQPCWQYYNGDGYKDVSVRGIHRDSVILDGSQTSVLSGRFLNLTGSHISIKDLTIRLMNGVDTSLHTSATYFGSTVAPCSGFENSNLLVENVLVEGAWFHGINLDYTSHAMVKNCEVRNTNLVNVNGREEGTGYWGSAIKVRLSDNIIIQNNKVDHNWGEGMGLGRSYDVLVHDNEVNDNYSVNIYPDNVIRGTIRNNLIYAGFEAFDHEYWRGAGPSTAIGIGAEYYPDNDFGENRDIYMYNNVILNTAAFYINDNRPDDEPQTATYDNIRFHHNSIFGWQGNNDFNLRVIAVNYGDLNAGNYSIDSFFFEHNIISIDSMMAYGGDNGRLMSGSSQPLPSTFFYGNNRWSYSPEFWSGQFYIFDSNSDYVDYNHNPFSCLPETICPSWPCCGTPTEPIPYPDQLYIILSPIIPYMENDYFNNSRVAAGYNIGAINGVMILSVNPISNTNIKLFPNPSTDKITLEGIESDNISINCYDVNGQFLFNAKEKEIDINHLNKGIYLLEIMTEEGVFSARFIKM